MKVKEKGLDAKAWKQHDRSRNDDRKQGQGNSGAGGKAGPGRNFNAFFEMSKLQEGKPANFATIPEGVAIVGTRPKTGGPQGRERQDKKGGDRKRQREDDGDESKPAKQVKLVCCVYGWQGFADPQEDVEIEFLDQKIKCDPTTGKPTGSFDFTDNVVIQWKNEQASGDSKEVKVGAAPSMEFK